MSNDVIIRVRVKEDAREGFAAVAAHAEHQGEQSGQKFTTRFGSVINRMGVLLQEHVKRAGTTIGTNMGEHSANNFVTRFGTQINTVTNRLTEIGKAIGEKVSIAVSKSVSDGAADGLADGLARGGSGGRGGDSTSTSRSSGAAGGRGGSGGRGGRGGSAGKVDVDVDKQSILARLGGLAADAASRFSTVFLNGLSTLLSPHVLLAAIGIAGLGYLIAPPLASAVASGILLALGGGTIALGVVAALRDPRIKGAADELKGRIDRLFTKFGEPFRAPVANFLEKLSVFIEKMTPNIEHLGKVLGPVADRLGSGIIGMLQNMLPGLIDAIEGSAPVFDVLADRLPDIGQALGDFFREIGQHGDEASVFFNDLITVLIKIIDWTGKLLGFFIRLYAGVRNFVSDAKELFLEFMRAVILAFERILNAAVIAFGWVPGLGGKLQTAKAQFADAQKSINAELRKIRDKTVTIRIRTVGLAVANAAVSTAERLAELGYGKATGGIVGQAASGGVRSGLTWVGERGPELANLAPGTRVWSAGDSARMAGASGDGGVLEVRYVRSGNAIIDAIFDGIELKIARKYGGVVQAGLGRSL